MAGPEVKIQYPYTRSNAIWEEQEAAAFVARQALPMAAMKILQLVDFIKSR